MISNREYINKVIGALYDKGIVCGECDVVDGYFFLDMAIASQKKETFLFDFDTEHKQLTVVVRFGEWIHSKPAYVSQLMYIALETANGAIFDAKCPGRLLLNMREADSALRFYYAANLPITFVPGDTIDIICKAVEAAFVVKPMIDRFCERAQNGSLTINEALDIQPVQEGEVKVAFHPIVDALMDKSEEDKNELLQQEDSGLT